ncbi:MAG TPA: exonuclease domain-containing protein [Micromonospora sp.]
MINKYAGTCATCGDRVAAGAGQAVNRDGRWQTYHDGCVPARVAPPVGTHAGWHDGPLVAFDVETTSNEPLDARIVAASLVHSGGATRTWLVNPGVAIPPRTTEIHGITDEIVARDGLPAADALAEIGTAVGKLVADGIPLVAFRASYDVTVLHTELARHGLPAIAWDQAVVVDPFVLHKEVEPTWFDTCTLGVLCDYYQVGLTRAHDATDDARAALDLARGIAARHHRVARLPLPALHEAQIEWYARDSRNLQNYYDRKGINKIVNDEWPLETRRRG